MSAPETSNGPATKSISNNRLNLPVDSPIPAKPKEAAIAAATKELDTLRNNWLNPPEWTRTEMLEFPDSVDGPWKRYIDPATVKTPHPNPLPRKAGGEGK